MDPFFFPSTSGQLYGVLHGGQAAKQGQVGVLLVSPWGQEAVRVQRLQHVLGERLSRMGHPTLRFDLYGTGESEGDDADGHPEAWINDILAADAELRTRSACTQVVWLGMRLGASLALLAARRAAPRMPAAVIAWEPIVNGVEYLHSLALDHVRALREALGPRAPRTAQACVTQAMGFSVGPAFRHQLEALNLADAAPPVCPVSLISERPLDLWSTMPSRAGLPRIRRSSFTHAIDWTSEQALNQSLVPGAAVQTLIGEFGSCVA